MLLDEPVESFLTDARAHLSDREVSVDQSGAVEETDCRLGLMVQKISDPAFEKIVIALIKRHNEVVAKNSTQV